MYWANLSSEPATSHNVRSRHTHTYARTCTRTHTNQWLPSPVVLVIKDVSISVKEVCEEFPQIVVVRLLKEVKPTHIPQVGGHLFCYIHRQV